MKAILAKILLLILVTIGAVGCEQKGTERSAAPQQSVMVTAANETAVMARLRAIRVAEASYLADSGREYGSLDQLIQRRYVSDPSAGKLTGYRFDVQVKDGGFQITAVPEKYGITGNRSFYLDESNIMHGADKKGAPATASDPEV